MSSESRRTPSRGPRGPQGRSVSKRPAPRPAAATPAAAATADGPRSQLTGRAAILVLVLAVLTVSYASSLRAYLDQRAYITDLKEQIALRQADIADLEREKRRWEDPAYLQQQARELNYVMPGETSYVVLDENGEPLERDSELTDPSTVAQKPPTAWWTNAWESVELAGNPPKPEDPPASRISGNGR